MTFRPFHSPEALRAIEGSIKPCGRRLRSSSTRSKTVYGKLTSQVFSEDQGFHAFSKGSPGLEEKRDVTFQPYLESYVISIALF